MDMPRELLRQHVEIRNSPDIADDVLSKRKNQFKNENFEYDSADRV